MTEPTAPPPVDVEHREAPTVMGLLAERARMTEGQLYTAVIALAVALLLTVTGLPTAHQRSATDSLSGPGAAPTAPTAPTTAPLEAP